VRAKDFMTENTSEIIVDLNGDIGESGIEGYVVDTDKENLANYLMSQGAPAEIAEKIKNQFERIGIIKNIWVDDEKRNDGIGNALLWQGVDAAIDLDAEAMILVADKSEGNEFDLVKWYESYDFEIIGRAGGDPVMLREL
jgi:ribosomal protein S18 acetylase RimI-like enzyme